MPETVTTTPRVVPGAPPPPAPSKSQKKKRKAGKPKEASESDAPVAVPDTATAALIEKAPEASDVKEGAVAPQLVAQVSEEPQTPAELKLSPIVDMLNKRLKANGKKIVSTLAGAVCTSCAQGLRHACWHSHRRRVAVGLNTLSCRPGYNFTRTSLRKS